MSHKLREYSKTKPIFDLTKMPPSIEQLETFKNKTPEINLTISIYSIWLKIAGVLSGIMTMCTMFLTFIAVMDTNFHSDLHISKNLFIILIVLMWSFIVLFAFINDKKYNLIQNIKQSQQDCMSMDNSKCKDIINICKEHDLCDQYRKNVIAANREFTNKEYELIVEYAKVHKNDKICKELYEIATS